MNTKCRFLSHVLFPFILNIASFSLFAAQPPITVKIAPHYGVSPGDTIDMSVVMASQQPLGGVDFTVQYVDSVFHFVSAIQDIGLNHWEYFVSVPGSISHSVRFVSIADLPNGPIHPSPGDFYPNGTVARLRSTVLPTWVQDSSKISFNFYWADCRDNATSNRLGDTLTILHQIKDTDGNLLWDETDNQNFPENNRIPNIGVTDSCLSGSTGILFNLDFRNGIAANYHICGDADANGVVNISDAVYLISYIFAGGPAPSPLAAGDVDCNAVANISDAVSLISYIFAGGSPPCQCAQTK